VRVRKCHHPAAILVLILGKSASNVSDCVCPYSAHDRWVGNHLEVTHAARKTQHSALKRKTTTLGTCRGRSGFALIEGRGRPHIHRDCIRGCRY
jgi:hypothetical protein